MKTKIIMGIDGGGTYTRVLIQDTQHNTLSHIKHNGGASYHKNPNAINDVQTAIKKAVSEANLQMKDIDVAVLGIAGYDKESDLAWVKELTNIPQLRAKVINLNDAKIAHAAALEGKPGIICIAGTGSIVLGKNEKNDYYRNYDFFQNANAAARMLTYDLVHHVLAGHLTKQDKTITTLLLNHFNCENLAHFYELASQGYHLDAQSRDQHFGDFARYITQEANNGSPICKEICEKVAKNIVMGIEIVSSTFTSSFIPVALIGSVANDTFIKDAIIKHLPKRFTFQDHHLDPEYGAIILGIEALENMVK